MVINSNNGSGGDSGVNIGGSIKRIEYNNIFISLLNDKLAGLSFASAGKVNLSKLLMTNFKTHHIFDFIPQHNVCRHV